MSITSTKLAVFILIAATLLGATVGIITLLTGKFGSTQIKILGTDAILAIGCICVLMCVQAVKTSNIGMIFGSIGAAASALTTLLLLKFIWTDASFFKHIEITATALIVSLACCHIVAMNWFDLSDGGYQLMGYISHAVVLIIAGMMISAVWFNFVGLVDYFWRAVGCLGIVCAMFTIIIPIVSKVTSFKVT